MRSIHFNATKKLSQLGAKMKSISIVLALITALSTQLISHQAIAKNYTQKQVAKDIEYLVKTLKRRHPNLYAHKSPKAFKAIVKNVKSTLNGTYDYYDLLPVFQTILAAVCDEHTSVVFKFPFFDGKTISFQDVLNDPILKEELYRSRFMAESLILTADTIFMDSPALSFNRRTMLAIGDFEPAEIQKRIRSITSADGCADNNVLLTGMLPLTHLITMSSLLQIEDAPIAKFKFQNDSTEKSYKISRRSFHNIVTKSNSSYSTANRVLTLKDFGFEVSPTVFTDSKGSEKHGIVVKSNPEKSIYYVFSSSFLGGKVQKKRTNKLLRELIAAKPKNVILDLTENPGGNLNTAAHFLSYFLPRSHRGASYLRMRTTKSKMPRDFKYLSKARQISNQKYRKQFRRAKKRNGQYKLRVRKTSFGNPDYKGNLSVLVSPNTHSAATMVAGVLKRKRKAKLFGYLNAGSVKTSCFAADGIHTLPNTKIKVTIPDTCFDRMKIAGQNGSILNLDFVTNPLGSTSNRLNSRTLKAALENIQNSN